MENAYLDDAEADELGVLGVRRDLHHLGQDRLQEL
jgi:hypothetical protein